MSESESEDEILDRIEAALRKIAGMSGATRPGESETFEHAALDRAALTAKLDDIIARLRDGLENAQSRTAPEGAPSRTTPEGAQLREEPGE